MASGKKASPTVMAPILCWCQKQRSTPENTVASGKWAKNMYVFRCARIDANYCTYTHTRSHIFTVVLSFSFKQSLTFNFWNSSGIWDVLLQQLWSVRGRLGWEQAQWLGTDVLWVWGYLWRRVGQRQERRAGHNPLWWEHLVVCLFVCLFVF